MSLTLFPHIFKNFVSPRHFSSQIQKKDQPVGSSGSPKELAQVGAFKKRILVWGGVYRNVNDVPEFVPRQTMIKTMDKFRVRFTFVLIVISGLGALSSVALAKGTLGEIEEEKSKQQ